MTEQDNTQDAAENQNPMPQPHGEATANAEPAKPRTLVYMPLPSDNDETESAGVKFRAYELVELPPSKAFLADKFASNAWFALTLDAVDPKRKEAWEKAREAQAIAEQAKIDAASAKAEADNAVK